MTNRRQNTFSRLMEKLWPRKFTRRYTRFPCHRDVSVVSRSRVVALQGRLIDMSQGGGLFRPPLRYLMERTGEEIILIVDGHEIKGKIVRTIPMGYSIQFDEEVDLRTVERVCAKAIAQRDIEDAEKASAETAAAAANPA